MKKKCKICGKVEETYPNSPSHILGLCEKHLEWFRQEKAKQEKGEPHDLPLWLI